MDTKKLGSTEDNSVGNASNKYTPKVSIDIEGKPLTEKMREKLGERIFLALTNSLETKCVKA